MTEHFTPPRNFDGDRGDVPPEQFEQPQSYYDGGVDLAEAVPDQRTSPEATVAEAPVEEEEQERPRRGKAIAIIGTSAVAAAAVATAAVLFLGGAKRGNDDDASAQTPGGSQPVPTLETVPGGTQAVETPASPTETSSEQLNIGEFKIGSQTYSTVAEARDSVFTITGAEAPGEDSARSEFFNAVRLGTNINTSEGAITALGGKDAAKNATAGLINEGLLTNLDPSADVYLPGQQVEKGNVADLVGAVNALNIENGSKTMRVDWVPDTGEDSTKLTGEQTGTVRITLQNQDGSETTLDLESSVNQKNNGQTWSYKGTFELPNA